MLVFMKLRGNAANAVLNYTFNFQKGIVFKCLINHELKRRFFLNING